MTVDKPFSQACENNKQPILQQLLPAFAHSTKVLEIGSGTGQHSVFLAPAMPHLIWQTSDVPDNHPGILLWHEEQAASNLRQPLAFTVGRDPWPLSDADGVFSANTAHIMQASETRKMMELVACHLPPNGVFCQYGPFKLEGQYTSQSNQEFDHSLRQRGFGGIRDLDELKQWAGPNLVLEKQVSMPANNLLLCWRKKL